VMEGRDIGTRVFPETPHKFFLTADPDVRARRRTEELSARGTPEPYERVLKDMETRDRDDGSRQDSPLTFDPSYVLVDSSHRPVEDVVSEIEARVRKAI
jgi:CMP/dCMP kinase